jgi:hypothetical protein
MLLQHPDQMARLRDTPTAIETAVEALLRYAGPLDTATEGFGREDSCPLTSSGDVEVHEQRRVPNSIRLRAS